MQVPADVDAEQIRSVGNMKSNPLKLELKIEVISFTVQGVSNILQ